MVKKSVRDARGRRRVRNTLTDDEQQAEHEAVLKALYEEEKELRGGSQQFDKYVDGGES
jgi:hypothetical protein